MYWRIDETPGKINKSIKVIGGILYVYIRERKRASTQNVMFVNLNTSLIKPRPMNRSNINPAELPIDTLLFLVPSWFIAESYLLLIIQLFTERLGTRVHTKKTFEIPGSLPNIYP